MTPALRTPAIVAGSLAALAAAVVIGAFLLGTVVLDGRPRMIDGLSVGADAGCGACDQPNTSDGCGACESVATIAARRLDQEFRGHAAVARITFHREGGYPGPNGETILHTRSGSLVVAVAELADGTTHAVGVYCGVGGCR